MENNKDIYISPFSTRYASREIQAVFSENFKFRTWRRLWIALARAEKALGLDIEVEYITDMEKIMGYGVMSMPAIVVNEKVVSMGKILKAADVEKLLKGRL